MVMSRQHFCRRYNDVVETVVSCHPAQTQALRSRASPAGIRGDLWRPQCGFPQCRAGAFLLPTYTST